MLLELAIGDAYGAGFEYASSDLVQCYNDLSRYVQHPRHQLKPGSYTDDTQMSLAIAQAIVAQEPWTPEVLATRFVETFKRDPREGYASRFYQFLLKIRDGREFLEAINWTSDKSGAAMRAGPMGVFPTVEKVIEAATIQAAIALAAASCSDEIIQDLPAHLIAGLENGPYGRDYIIELDRQLMNVADQYKLTEEANYPQH
jgi:ADP-ribosylglycohydrolase